MKKGLVRDAETAAIVAKVNDLLHGCEVILSEHGSRCAQGLYGQGVWSDALGHDIMTVRARLDRVRALVAGAAEQLPQ